jgi:transposase-like protein
LASLHSPITTNRRLSASESGEIARAAAAGASVTAVAARFGVSRPTVYRAIEKHRASDGTSRGSAAEARITIRLEPFELAGIDRLAARQGVSRAGLARSVLRRASGFLEADPEVAEAVRELARQVKTIGGNLNQIASHLNREARQQGKASLSAARWKQIEATERDLKALARQLDGLFVHAVTRRRARLADLLREDRP